MVEPVITLIKNKLLTSNPNTFQKGYSLGRKYQDGRVVIYTQGEGEYVGLQDTKSNYFYIRYLDEIPLTEPIQRGQSCPEIQGDVPLRLVAWVKNANQGKLIEVLIQDVMGTDFNTLSADDKKRFSDLRITYNQIVTDGEQIFKDETNGENEDVKQVKNVTLVALDFTLIFNYRIKSNTCVDRDICVGCS